MSRNGKLFRERIKKKAASKLASRTKYGSFYKTSSVTVRNENYVDFVISRFSQNIQMEVRSVLELQNKTSQAL